MIGRPMHKIASASIPQPLTRNTTIPRGQFEKMFLAENALLWDRYIPLAASLTFLPQDPLP